MMPGRADMATHNVADVEMLLEDGFNDSEVKRLVGFDIDEKDAVSEGALQRFFCGIFFNMVLGQCCGVVNA